MAQPLLPESIQAHVQGDITGQVAIGNNIIQIGSVHGGVVNILAPKDQPRPRRRPSPVFLRPRPFPGLLDRETEVDTANSALSSSLPVEFSGEKGIGKTTLLKHMAYHPSADLFPAGVIYHRVRKYPVSDILQEVFRYFYESDAAFMPTDAEIRDYLHDERALILLDDVEVPWDEVETLMDYVPNCTFVLASKERCLWGEGCPLVLEGLPLDHAMALVEQELRRSLTPEERPDAEALCTALEGHPLRIKQEVARVREDGTSLAEVAREVQIAISTEALTEQILTRLPKPQQNFVAILAALGGAPVGADYLTAMMQIPDVAPILETLQQRGLVETHSPRYSLAGTLGKDLRKMWNLDLWREQALDYFTTWAEEHRAAPERLLEEADAILEVLRWGVATGRWKQVLRLGRAVEGALALGKQWGAWGQVLQWLLQAARAVGDRAVEAFALHQVGTRALCLEDVRTARAYLTEALKLREALGDRIGADVTRHNVEILLGQPPPPKGPSEAPSPPSAGGLPLVPIVALVSALAFPIAALVCALVVTLGGLMMVASMCSSSQPPLPAPTIRPRPTPQPTPLPPQPRVDIWLDDGCDNEYNPSDETWVFVEANVEGLAEIGVDDWSLEERWLASGESWPMPWTFEDMELGEHYFWVELSDDSGEIVTADKCRFAIVTTLPAPPEPTLTSTPIPPEPMLPAPPEPTLTSTPIPPEPSPPTVTPTVIAEPAAPEPPTLTPTPPTLTAIPSPTATPDTTGPSITNIDPLAGGRVYTGACSGGPTYPTTLSIGATVTDPSGVRWVEFYCTLPGQGERYCGGFVRIIFPQMTDIWVMMYDPAETFEGTVSYRIKATDDSPARNVSWSNTGYIQVYEVPC